MSAWVKTIMQVRVIFRSRAPTAWGLGGRLPKLAATGVPQAVGGTVILKDLPLARTEESTYGRPRWILRCTQNDRG